MTNVIFFRSNRNFRPPSPGQFPRKLGRVNITVIDVPDFYNGIKLAWERISGELFNAVSKNDKKVYLCGAVSLGFVWHLSRWIQPTLALRCEIVWLQMQRSRDLPVERKAYEVWDNFF